MLALLFPLGPETYALPLELVREVVAAPVMTPLPTAPPAVMGLVNLRGDVLPVFDPTTMLGSPFQAPARYVMVVDTPAGPAGLAAGGLPRIVELEPPEGGDGTLRAGSVHMVDGRAVAVLDALALLEQAVAGARG
jgi:purine-binding chemotaxis protein CheW